MDTARSRFKPFLLTFGIIVLDQLTKALIVKYIPLNTVGFAMFGDLVWICHVRNTGAAFSLGAEGAAFFRIVVFIILPVSLMAALCLAIATRRNILTGVQRWLVAGIAGGGVGTLIDRIFRFRTGVVDFISIRFFGIFGLERWPTFNVSDSCVVIFVILFAISVLFPGSLGQADGNKGSKEGK